MIDGLIIALPFLIMPVVVGLIVLVVHTIVAIIQLEDKRRRDE